MERLFYWFITGWILVAAAKVLIMWLMQKLLNSKAPTERTKLMNSRATFTSKMFNELLKAKKLNTSDINSIAKILNKYAGNNSYKNSVHKIYSVLKYQPIKNKDLADIQLILMTKKAK